MPAAAASLGIPVLECNDFMLPPPRLSRLRRPLLSLLPGPPPELWRYSRAGLNALLTTAHAHRCLILAWTINSDFAVSTRHWPAQQLYLRRGLSAAHLLHASLLRLNLGGSPGTPAAHDQRIARRLANLVASAAQRAPGLSFTIENHWGLSADIDRHLRIFDHAAALLPPSLRSSFGCCFDPANLPASHPDRNRWWRELARRANHYHLKTTAFTPAGDDLHLPHAALFTLLREQNYSGYYTIEFAGDGDPAEGIHRTTHLFLRLANAT
jgi:sugar phosphate isomerase/epimerase